MRSQRDSAHPPGQGSPDNGKVLIPAAEQALVLVVGGIGGERLDRGDAVPREKGAAACPACCPVTTPG